MNAVILAGGLGTRMKPLTETLPKWLLPVGSQSFAEIQLADLARQGVKRVLVCLGHFADRVRESIPSGAPWGIQLDYVEDGSVLRGTAGALRKAFNEGKLPESFLLLYGDSFLPIDFAAFWDAAERLDQPATMAVLSNENCWDTSNVAYDREKKLIIRYDKNPERRKASGLVFDAIDYGLSHMRSSLISRRIPADQISDLADLYFDLSGEGALGALEVKERFYEIGSPAGLADFKRYLESHSCTIGA